MSMSQRNRVQIAALLLGCGVLGAGATCHAQAAPAGACLDTTEDADVLGTWPTSASSSPARIYYQYVSGYPHWQAVEAAMRQWEDRSAHMIEFKEDPSQAIKLTIADCVSDANGNLSGSAPGHNACLGGNCNAFLCPGNAVHELGHALGLLHQQQRYDRDHYVRMDHPYCRDTTLPDAKRQAEPRSSTDHGDFGPYNYQSTMHYAPNNDTNPPRISPIRRWDGSEVCHSVVNGLCMDGASGPNGDVKAGDGAAIIELYGRGNGWTKFDRTFGTGNPTPYRRDLAPHTDNLGLGIYWLADDASPAVESWNDSSFALYARTTGDAIVKKYWDPQRSAWSEWSAVGPQPIGTGDLSDPAVVSWGSGRTDLAVRRGADVYLMSTPIWGTWDSLGSPPGGAASAPAITSKGANHLAVFVRSTDDRIYFKECTADCAGSAGTWTQWSAIGTEVFKGKPAVVSRGDVINLVAHGLTGTIWLTEYRDGVWSDWGDEGIALVLNEDGCPDCTSPALGSHSSDSLDIYVRGLDDHVWLLTWSRNGLQTTALGGVTPTSPSVLTRQTNGRADVFANMLEEALRGTFYAGIWSKTRSSF